MAITSGASAGIEVTTAAADEITGGGLPSQTQANGVDEVVTSDTWANLNNGNITAPTGFVGRLCIIRQGAGDEETRLITADAAGTGATRILTVAEAWVVQPATSDSFYVSYSSDDMEAFTGMTLNSKTGVYEGGTSREWAVGQGTNFAYAAAFGYQGWETPDRAAEANVKVKNNARLDFGYVQGGEGIQGAIVTAINNTAAELVLDVEAGGIFRCYASLFRSWLEPTALQFTATADVVVDGTTFKDTTDDLSFLVGTITDVVVTGKEGSAEYLRCAEELTLTGMTLAGTAGLNTEASDTTTETLTLRDVVFINNIDYITLNSNKTWDMINPTWAATTYTDFSWDTSTSNGVNDLRSVDAVVQEADGTKLQNALVNIYENTQGDDLVLETTTDVDGIASGTFVYKSHVTNSATTTYGGHAFQCGKWLYLPFVAAQVSTDKFDGTVVLSPDNNIVQTTQATAESAGSGVTWNEDTNPSELFDFTGGSGTLAVGMILTFSPSGAIGTITESLSGDSTAGTIHLDTRNATAIANADTFSRTGGTAGTFSGTYTNNTSQAFSIHIDGNSLSYQTLYDYLASIQFKTTLGTDGELIWEWCRSAQTQPLYSTGSSFYTERSNGKGLIIINAGAGVADYFTDDADVQWVPPSSVTLTVNIFDSAGDPIQDCQVSIHDSSDVELMNADTNASGIATAAYTYTGDEAVTIRARKSSSGTRYFNNSATGTIESTGLTVTITMLTDSIAS